ncbi:MAG: hypothetical protein IT385_13230 [Deltaproteobacteria bacterium]|nr:hypothetical protein [Deltaproteobacteria bacterium]
MGVLITRPALVALAALALSCDATVDARYRGDPVFSFEGQLVQFEGLPEQSHAFVTTLMWLTDLEADPATQGPRLASAIEQAAASVELRFPSTFRVDLFAAPEDRMLVPGTGYGVALVVVYEDRDGNGRLTLGASPSELVGGARYEALVYARDEAAARAAPFDEPIAGGFQLVRIPLFCGGEVEVPACTTPLGAACADDVDCGAEGVCLTELDGVSWPGGACALREDTVTCLPPEDAGAYITLDDELWLIQGCDGDGDCRQGYGCDELSLGCVPEALFSPRRREAAGPCDVGLGAPCVVDQDCGAGVCLVRSNFESFVGGYCALPITAATAACAPVDGRAIPWDYREDGGDTHWFRACASDDDCRVDAGYTCDAWLEVCLPSSPVALELGGDFTPSAVCYGAVR